MSEYFRTKNGKENVIFLSDLSQAIEEEGKRLCSLADPFTEDCLYYVAARDVEQNLYPILQNKNAKPMKVMPRIFGIVQTYLPAEVAQPMARDMLFSKIRCRSFITLQSRRVKVWI